MKAQKLQEIQNEIEENEKLLDTIAVIEDISDESYNRIFNLVTYKNKDLLKEKTRLR